MYLLEYDNRNSLYLQNILNHKSLKEACFAYEFQKRYFKSFEAMDSSIKNDKGCGKVVRITKLHGYNPSDILG